MSRTDVYVVYVDSNYFDSYAYRSWLSTNEDDRLSEPPAQPAVSALSRQKLNVLLDQLHPVDAERMRDNLAGLSTKQIAAKYSVTEMAVHKSIKRAVQRLYLYALLPDIEETAFREALRVYVACSVHLVTNVERRLSVLWAFWQTTSTQRTYELTGSHPRYTRRYIDQLIELLEADQNKLWFDAWTILRDNKGLRNKDNKCYKR